ncbi:hypothetical protein EYF80_067482 [Liparis tanakae]|uniref:Uncharacterized protein n=1 Tax=Liparis tanakae TaxID=230148 RepID=A0A4Z2E0Z1_9TELE|nr:hypothetical protein EYF80_067482 [Liparis tanakae]
MTVPPDSTGSWTRPGRRDTGEWSQRQDTGSLLGWTGAGQGALEPTGEAVEPGEPGHDRLEQLRSVFLVSRQTADSCISREENGTAG